MKLLSGGQLRDIAKEYIIDIGKVNCAVSNMILDQVKLNIDKTQITPIDTTSAFDFKVQNLGLNFLFQYDMLSDFAQIDDKGVGRAIFNDISLALDLSLYLDKKRVYVNVDKVNLNISDLKLILQGGEFSDIMN